MSMMTTGERAIWAAVYAATYSKITPSDMTTLQVADECSDEANRAIAGLRQLAGENWTALEAREITDAP